MPDVCWQMSFMEAMNQAKATRMVTVANRAGLHARAALLVYKCVQQFEARVELIRDRQRVDAGDMLQMMTLGAAQGTVLVLEATGRDADMCLDALEKLFADKFFEEDDT